MNHDGHGWLMIAACLLPMLAVAALPALGITGLGAWAIIVALLVVCLVAHARHLKASRH